MNTPPIEEQEVSPVPDRDELIAAFNEQETSYLEIMIGRWRDILGNHVNLKDVVDDPNTPENEETLAFRIQIAQEVIAGR